MSEIPDTATCQGCGYSLRGLPEPVCPECGRTFDPEDSSTFRLPSKPANKRLTIIGLYLLPLVLSLGCWASMDSKQWDASGYGMPLLGRVFVGIWQACGPFAWVTIGSHWAVISLVFIATWGGWLTLVCISPLRKLSYWLHFVLSLVWCLSGCPPTGLVIT